MNYIQIFNAIIIILITVLVSRVGKYFLIKIGELTVKTKTSWDNEMIKGLELPFQLFVVLIGINFATRYLVADLMFKGINLRNLFFSLFALLIAYTIAKILTVLFNWYQQDVAVKTSTDVDDTLLPILKRVIIIAIYALAGLMILDKLNINISPILASLGVAGLAVGLALQDTLSNFFSAVYITIDRPVKVGDYIELDTGTRGYVIDIGWRSTRIQTLSGNNIIFPNSKLSQAVITNYEGPDPQVSVKIEASVSYDSDLEKVEQAVMQVAKKVLVDCEGGVSDYEPLFRFSELHDSSIGFKVILKAQSYVDQFKLRHDFIRQLIKKFREENITIPFPQMDVHVLQKNNKTKNQENN
jgi:small-conductance mechanosensitive channel